MQSLARDMDHVHLPEGVRVNVVRLDADTFRIMTDQAAITYRVGHDGIPVSIQQGSPWEQPKILRCDTYNAGRVQGVHDEYVRGVKEDLLKHMTLISDPASILRDPRQVKFRVHNADFSGSMETQIATGQMKGSEVTCTIFGKNGLFRIEISHSGNFGLDLLQQQDKKSWQGSLFIRQTDPHYYVTYPPHDGYIPHQYTAAPPWKESQGVDSTKAASLARAVIDASCREGGLRLVLRRFW